MSSYMYQPVGYCRLLLGRCKGNNIRTNGIDEVCYRVMSVVQLKGGKGEGNELLER